MKKETVLDNACYQSVFSSVSEIINVAKVSAARSVNAAMTAAGKRISGKKSKR